MRLDRIGTRLIQAHVPMDTWKKLRVLAGINDKPLAAIIADLVDRALPDLPTGAEVA